MVKTPKKIGVGYRCAQWLRASYSFNRGKSVARDFNVSENTAWLWMSGKTPSVWHLEAMVARWGRAFLEYIFQDIDNHSEPIEIIINIRAELARRDTNQVENKSGEIKPTTESGRYSSNSGIVPPIWYEGAPKQRSRSELISIERTRLVFELQLTYQMLVMISTIRQWHQPLTIPIAALFRRLLGF